MCVRCLVGLLLWVGVLIEYLFIVGVVTLVFIVGLLVFVLYWCCFVLRVGCLFIGVLWVLFCLDFRWLVLVGCLLVFVC